MASIFEGIDSKIVEKESTRLPSGIPGFDDLLGGGFPDGSLYILSGPYGGHNATFAQQVLYNRIVSKGKVAYYIIENPGNDIIEDMALFSWNIEGYVDDGSWKFVRLLPPTIEKIVKLTQENPMEEGIPLRATLAPLQDDFLARLKDNRWCMLNISYLLQNFGSQDIMELLIYMIAAVRKYGGVHFLLLTEGLVDNKIANMAKDLVDGVFEFEDSERAIEYGTTLHIRKMRKTVLSTRTIKITLMPSGMVAETVSRI